MYGRVCVCGRGACMAGGHAWCRDMCGNGACMVGVMHGRGACMVGGHVWQGVCMAGGMCGVGDAWQGGHVLQGGACVAGGGGRAWQILRDTVNERTVRILLECNSCFDYHERIVGGWPPKMLNAFGSFHSS